MKEGELGLEYTLGGFLTAGYSHLELFFRRLGEKRVSVMAPFGNPSGFRCASCGTVIISGRNGTTSECLKCGTLMEPGITVCPKCGWTYEARLDDLYPGPPRAD
jgi:ribosomal protein L32